MTFSLRPSLSVLLLSSALVSSMAACAPVEVSSSSEVGENAQAALVSNAVSTPWDGVAKVYGGGVLPGLSHALYEGKLAGNHPNHRALRFVKATECFGEGLALEATDTDYSLRAHKIVFYFETGAMCASKQEPWMTTFGPALEVKPNVHGAQAAEYGVLLGDLSRWVFDLTVGRPEAEYHADPIPELAAYSMYFAMLAQEANTSGTSLEALP